MRKKKKKFQKTVLDPNGEFNGKLTFEALRAMKKLEFAVRETVRLFFFFLFSQSSCYLSSCTAPGSC